MAEDYYKILGVRREASQPEIQKAYREMARKCHPDMNPGDKTAKKKFQQIQQAFEVLNNPEKREMYDRYGSSFETAGSESRGPRAGTWSPGAGGPGGFNPEEMDFSQFFGERFGGQESPGGFADIFSNFRRQGASRGRKPAKREKGADVAHELEIPLHTAISGGEVQITVERATSERETISIRIPKGVEDGKKIRLRGQGQASPEGGTPGDILLTIHVQPHPYFQRQGNNLLVKVPVTLGEAVCGTKVDVPAAAGTVSVRVPPGTSSGTKLRVKGQGVEPVKGTPGDLLAEVQIVLPKGLSDADREALGEIDRHYSQNPRANLHW